MLQATNTKDLPSDLRVCIKETDWIVRAYLVAFSFIHRQHHRLTCDSIASQGIVAGILSWSLYH